MEIVEILSFATGTVGVILTVLDVLDHARMQRLENGLKESLEENKHIVKEWKVALVGLGE